MWPSGAEVARCSPDPPGGAGCYADCRGLSLTVENFNQALADELFATRSLLPHDGPMWGCGCMKEPDEWAFRRCTVEFAPVPGRIVSVRKQGNGVRPVAELAAIRDRGALQGASQTADNEARRTDHPRGV